MKKLGLPDKNLQVIRISKQEVLEILCDYFLNNNPASFDEWHANFVEGENGLEYVAIFGSSDDPTYRAIKNTAFGNN